MDRTLFALIRTFLTLCLFVFCLPHASAEQLVISQAGFAVTLPHDFRLVQRSEEEAKQPGRTLPANFCFPRFGFGGVWFGSFLTKLGDHETVQQYAEHHLKREQGNPDTFDYKDPKVLPFRSEFGVDGFLYSVDAKPKKSACWDRHRGVVFTNRQNQVVCLYALGRVQVCGGPSNLDSPVFASLRLQ